MTASKEEVLDFLKRTAEAIAITFGPTCETLVHDMTKSGRPILAIFNSHISGRTIGSTADIYGDEVYQESYATNFRIGGDVINAHVFTHTGRHVKSTTILFKGTDFYYGLGFNFDYTAVHNAMDTLYGLTRVDDDMTKALAAENSSQLDEIFNECMTLLGKPACDMRKRDRLQLIALLMQKKAFRYQKAITYVADQLGVSRYTVYNYIHEVEEHPLL